MTTPTTPPDAVMPPLPKAEYVMGGKGYCGVDMYDYAQAYAAQQVAERDARVKVLEEALAWAMARIEKKAQHQAIEGDGELYSFAAARAALTPKEQS